jgi:hypothetical protein
MRPSRISRTTRSCGGARKEAEAGETGARVGEPQNEGNYASYPVYRHG